MAGDLSISSLSSLSDSLYYQYLINHNSTSTMLNALSGDTEESTDGSSLLNGVNLGQGSGTLNSALSSLSGLGGTSSDGDELLSAASGLSSFSNILQTYMSSQQTEAADMAEQLSTVLDEAAKSEDTSSLSYQTVQDLYQYFLNKTSTTAASLNGAGTDSTDIPSSDGMGAVAQNRLNPSEQTEFDFDSLESELQNSIDASMQQTPV